MLFIFRELEKEENKKEFDKLSNNEASRHSEFHTKFIKSNSDIFF